MAPKDRLGAEAKAGYVCGGPGRVEHVVGRRFPDEIGVDAIRRAEPAVVGGDNGEPGVDEGLGLLG
jgi:hypothetical protein